MSIQFFGDFGHSLELKAHQCKEKDQSNSLNEIIHFHSKSPDLGNVFKIVLKQGIGANKKIKTRWYLEKVKISHLKESFIFPFQKWITNYDKDKKVRKFEMKLYEEVSFICIRNHLFFSNKLRVIFRPIKPLGKILTTQTTIQEQ